MNDPQASPNVSVEQNGRVLTGGPGASLEVLEQAIERDQSEGGRATSEQTAPNGSDSTVQRGVPQTDSKPTRGQARFSELTKEREAAKQAAKDANDRAVALESRLKAIEDRAAQTGTPGPDVSQPRAAAATSSHQEAAPSASRPKPSEDEVGTTYKNYAEFVEDLTDWKAEQRELRANNERAQQARVEGWKQRYEASLAQYPDFAEVLKSGAGGQVDVRQDYIDRLMETPGGEHAVYHMAKDAATARRVDGMSEYEFGMFVRSLIPAETTAPPAPVVTRASKTAPPYQPVGGGGRTTVTTSAEIASKGGGFDEYRLKRAAERGVKPKYR